MTDTMDLTILSNDALERLANAFGLAGDETSVVDIEL